MEFETKAIKKGKFLGIIIPKDIVERFNLKKNQVIKIDISLENSNNNF